MTIVEIIKKEFRLRIIEEGLHRIIKCCSLLSDDQLWHRPNANSNAIANLILHLEGNVRQYILSGIGNQPDTRKRDHEFDTQERIPRAELIAALETTLNEAADIVDGLDEEALTRLSSAQGFQMHVLAMVIHVIEHFSYHVGQITYYTKQVRDVDTGYYEGMDLNKKSK